MAYRGLTWDHPRGYQALEAASAQASGVIAWDRQPLEGFEAHPIADLCARYDVIVIDHPHVGEAVAAKCLRPLETLFTDAEIAELRREAIGPSLDSYRYGGAHWALPLDAASQVMAYRVDLLDEDPPETWAGVAALGKPVALSLAGPHAALTLWSIATAFDDPPAVADPEQLFAGDGVLAALDVMADLAARTPAMARELNPIGLLGAMATGTDVVLCPLVYGYVNYAAPADPAVSPLGFADAPRRARGGRPGSTLGGTGIAVSTRAQLSPELLGHLRWLMSAAAQTCFIPDHAGQPSRRAAWRDARVNRDWSHFYAATEATLEHAYVRPRHAGAIAFQTRAAELIRAGLGTRRPHAALRDDLQAAYAASRQSGAER
jgi:multiple sugar transport system substrate-binding protein